jgi:hypothetical protein
MPSKSTIQPEISFRAILARVQADLVQALNTPFNGIADVLNGDAREAAEHVSGHQFDWVVFSPPYPNNIDYTEVYKVEAWALELYENPQQMKAQRLNTLRSHPSVNFPDTYEFERSELEADVEELLAPLLRAVPTDRYARGRLQVIKGYTDDIHRVLLSTRQVTTDHGQAAIIVGNSAHGHGDGRFVVASDLLIARLAELSGWRVDEIRIARRPTRRPGVNAWLRESVVALSAI